jgi:hypothetical protein
MSKGCDERGGGSFFIDLLVRHRQISLPLGEDVQKRVEETLSHEWLRHGS